MRVATHSTLPNRRLPSFDRLQLPVASLKGLSTQLALAHCAGWQYYGFLDGSGRDCEEVVMGIPAGGVGVGEEDDGGTK